MATTIHESPRLTSHGGGPQNPPPSRNLRAVDDTSPASRTGIWVALAAITMMFAAFTSAMVVRQGASLDWRHFDLPWVLYLDTVILLASSGTLELARKRVASHSSRSSAQLLLWLTLGLGLLFVAGQYAAWQQLRSEGLYLATNSSSSFFYLFTALHAVHVLGGLAALMLVLWRFRLPAPTLRLSTLSAVAYYWHFIDVLWIYLLVLLWTRI